MSETSTSVSTFDPGSMEFSPSLSDEERCRRVALLERMEALRQRILTRRGGVHITREEIDETLEAVRGGDE